MLFVGVALVAVAARLSRREHAADRGRRHRSRPRSSTRSTAPAPDPSAQGTVGEFPGADTPFGMIQWSPDTSPNAVQSGGGYDDADSQINGFSLTHLSGTGCPSYQDVPILPTVGAIGTAAPEPTTMRPSPTNMKRRRPAAIRSS